MHSIRHRNILKVSNQLPMNGHDHGHAVNGGTEVKNNSLILKKIQYSLTVTSVECKLQSVYFDNRNIKVSRTVCCGVSALCLLSMMVLV